MKPSRPKKKEKEMDIGCYVKGPRAGRCVSRKDIFRLIKHITDYRQQKGQPLPPENALKSEKAAIKFMNEEVQNLDVYKDTMEFISRNIPELISGYSLENQRAADYWYRFIPGAKLDTPGLVNVRPLVPVNWVYCSPNLDSSKKQFLCSYAWLSNYDIDMILTPLTHLYKDTVIFPAAGCDFMDYTRNPRYESIKSYSPDKMREYGKKRMALPLISHRVSEPNSPIKHWFSVFIDYDHDSKKAIVATYDSQIPPAGNRTQKGMKFHQIARKSVVNGLFADSDYEVTFVNNSRVVQKRDGQCGMYAIDYLVSRIEGMSHEDYEMTVSGDSSMESLRRKYFFFPGIDTN